MREKIKRIKRGLSLVLALSLLMSLGGGGLAYAATTGAGDQNAFSGGGMIESPESLIKDGDKSADVMDALNAAKVTKPGKVGKVYVTKDYNGTNNGVKFVQYEFSWTAATNATGYQIQASTKSNYSNHDNAYTTSTYIYRYTAGKYVGKKYYVRVRAFRISGNKVYYGAWKKFTYKSTY